jgi:hypothetical protein
LAEGIIPRFHKETKILKDWSMNIEAHLPKAEIISEAEKIADMGWIVEIFRGLIITES